VLWPTHHEAINAPKGNVDLYFCPSCGHIFNVDFDPSLMKYTQTYENSLHFSPRFQRYADSLATRLVEQYHLRDKDIIEIGCGQGDFLKSLCEIGDNRGVGFDPSYVPEPIKKDLQLTFIQDYYSKAYQHYNIGCVCCRHVLEHIQNPIDFLTSIRQAIGNRPDTVVYFEVPNALFTLRDLGIWDIIYEHCSYFCSHSLTRLFTRSGFKVNHIAEQFDGQFLGIEAFPAENELTKNTFNVNLKEMAS
jgi:hypothetical protein